MTLDERPRGALDGVYEIRREVVDAYWAVEFVCAAASNPTRVRALLTRWQHRHR